jgi:DNA-directed RNA polymerase subunit RPC12/RpoP
VIARACDVYDACADCVAEGIAEQEADRLADIAAENARRAQFGDPPIGCEACGARQMVLEPSYIDGADADGNRGRRLPAEYVCGMCGWAVRA